MDTVELAAKVRATQILEDAGYIKKKCPRCQGRKMIAIYDCTLCDGKGFTWKAPDAR